MAQCHGPRAHIRLFFIFTYIRHKNVGKIPKCQGSKLNVNPAWAITWLVGVTIYCRFFNNNSPPPRQFLCDKILLKKISYSKENAHWTKICELRRPGSPSRICTPITGCFHHKTIIYKENFQVDCYSLLKYRRRQCTLLPPTWTKSLTKFDSKMQDFKRVLDWNCKQKTNWTS